MAATRGGSEEGGAVRVECVAVDVAYCCCRVAMMPALVDEWRPIAAGACEEPATAGC